MRIEKKLINELIPAPYNPRKDLKKGDPEYEKLKKSITEFNYIDPVIWNEQTGRVVGGYQRLKVLRELGYTQVDVSVVDLPEEKEKALNLALNKTGGNWDMPKLRDLLFEIDTGAFDIEITGFGQEEIEDMMKQFEPVDIDELLNELDMSQAIEKPIWATIRTKPENQKLLDQALAILEQNGIRVERSYDA